MSKCFSGDSSISPATRARVLELADQVGYRPPRRSVSGASRSGKRPVKTVGVMLRLGDEAGYAGHRMQLLEGLSAAARQHQVRLTLEPLTANDEQTLLDDPKRLPLMWGGRPDGLIVWHAFASGARAVERLAELGPCVTVNNHYFPGLRVDAVSPNHFDGIVSLVEHLHGLGHRRIGLLGNLHQHVWGPQRAGAFLAAMLKLGLPDDPSLRLDTGHKRCNRSGATRRAVELTRGDVTAWVAMHLGDARLLQRTFADAGISVPAGVSIVSLGSADAAGDGLPPLTQLTAPWRDIGRHALLRLLDRFSHPGETGRRVLLDYELTPGQTTGPARST